jgi:hypothetical protein
MNFDMSHLLDRWEYRPGQVMVRRFVGKDGQEKIQLRVDLGILQMNAEGRPDGKKPMGYASLFEFFLGKQLQSEKSKKQEASEFALNAEDCSRLQLESFQYHHRYICLLQLEDFDAVLRDTDRNLKLFDFVEEHAETEELSWSFQQFRPQVLMIQTRARAAKKLETKDFAGAIQEIEKGLQTLREFYSEYSRTEMLDQSAEILSLQNWMEELNKHRPLSKREQLLAALDEAVKKEDYEEAAKVRDALKKLGD